MCPKKQNDFYFDNFSNYYQIGRYNHDIAFRGKLHPFSFVSRGLLFEPKASDQISF